MSEQKHGAGAEKQSPAKNRTPFEWERIDYQGSGSDDFTERAPVPDGWLVRTYGWDRENGRMTCMAMVFVCDPDGSWLKATR